VASWGEQYGADLQRAADTCTFHPRLAKIQRELIDLIEMLDPGCDRYPDKGKRLKLPDPG
jgi:hypothetical protein